MEKRLLEDLERLCTLADKPGDSSVADAVQSKFLRKEAQHVKDLADLLSRWSQNLDDTMLMDPFRNADSLEQEERQVSEALLTSGVSHAFSEDNIFTKLINA